MTPSTFANRLVLQPLLELGGNLLEGTLVYPPGLRTFVYSVQVSRIPCLGAAVLDVLVGTLVYHQDPDLVV